MAKKKKAGKGAAASKAPNKCKDPSFLESLALLGDSGFALFGSFVLLLAAILISWNTDDSQLGTTASLKQTINDADFNDLYQNLGPAPKIDLPHVYSKDSIEPIHQAYRKDGVVAVRGLIPASLLGRLDVESSKLVEKENPKRKKQNSQQFHAQCNGAAFLDPPSVEIDEESHKVENVTAFLEVALMSQVASLASELMLPELNDGETVRMMRDIFLARSSDQEFACGWHVDDTGFWPATASSPGINAWIALDDMPSIGGGGFALAVGSHESSWRHDAQYITGATTFFPPEGFQSAADMFANRTGSGTCNIQTSAPHLYRRMEETKRIYSLRKGDVIFHQRFLFHRTVPFEKDYADAESDPLVYRRYSVRYSPGSAIVPPRYGTELSVLWNEDNGGRSADDVSNLDGPWYPQAWPSTNAKELQDLKSLVADKLPIAEKRKQQRKKEMQPFLKQAASKNGKPGRH